MTYMCPYCYIIKDCKHDSGPTMNYFLFLPGNVFIIDDFLDGTPFMLLFLFAEHVRLLSTLWRGSLMYFLTTQ